MTKIRLFLKRFHQAYSRFVEKQGFPIIVGVCVAVIAGTALWTRQAPSTPAAPTPPVNVEAAEAAQLLQEKLSATPAPTPSPTPAPLLYDAPLPQTRVLQGFDAARLARVGSSRLWALHDAADLAADVGTPVKALTGGIVTSVDTQGTTAVSVTIDHGNGLIAAYAGMSEKTALLTGDPVEKGQTVGFVGAGIAGEAELAPHLHLRVTRNGVAIDPTLLW